MVMPSKALKIIYMDQVEKYTFPVQELAFQNTAAHHIIATPTYTITKY